MRGCMYTCMCSCVYHLYVYVCRACVYVCVCVYTRACVCVYVYMCVLGVRVAGAFMVLDDRNDLFLVAHSDQSKD